MVVLETSYALVCKYIGKKIPRTELEETLFSLGFECEGVDGDVLRVDVTPDRLDVLSGIGLARLLGMYLQSFSSASKKYEAKKSLHHVIVDASVATVRPYTVCAVVRGLKLTDDLLAEIIRVQEKLHATLGKQRKKAAMGIYPLDAIAWPITYTAKKPQDITFVPLGSSKKMTAAQMLKEHPIAMQYAHLLEGYAQYSVFLDSLGHVLSVPPIINSQDTGRVTVDTKDVFIEVSGFELKTLHAMLTLYCCMLADMGGLVEQVSVVYGNKAKKTLLTPQLEYEKRTISVVDVNERIGIAVNAAQICVLLKKMGHRIVSSTKQSVTFEVPPYRLDIWHDVDIIDDIARAYGINNILLRVPQVSTVGGLTVQTRFAQLLRDAMVGHGLVEIRTLGVTDKNDQFSRMQLSFDAQPFIALGSTAERSINMLRYWLLPESMKFLASNKSNTYPQQLFEIADVVRVDPKEDVRSQNTASLCVTLAGDGFSVTNARQILESVLRTAGVSDSIVTFAAQTHASFIPGRRASVLVDGVSIGLVGEVHPSVLDAFGVEVPVSAFEIDVDALLQLL